MEGGSTGALGRRQQWLHPQNAQTLTHCCITRSVVPQWLCLCCPSLTLSHTLPQDLWDTSRQDEPAKLWGEFKQQLDATARPAAPEVGWIFCGGVMGNPAHQFGLIKVSPCLTTNTHTSPCPPLPSLKTRRVCCGVRWCVCMRVSLWSLQPSRWFTTCSCSCSPTYWSCCCTTSAAGHATGGCVFR
jgi:hypothetical protein